jgi:hypothetical protein
MIAYLNTESEQLFGAATKRVALRRHHVMGAKLNNCVLK